MFLHLGAFWLFLGLGMILGLIWVVVRYGIPLVVMAMLLVIELLRQVVWGFWSGLTGKPLRKSPDSRRLVAGSDGQRKQPPLAVTGGEEVQQGDSSLAEV